jgi:hypothetical protein
MTIPTESGVGSDGADPPWVDGLWSGACPAGTMPQWAVEIATLIESARGPATTDERAGEPFVVARMHTAMMDRGAGSPVSPDTRHADAAAMGDGDRIGGDVTQLVVRRRRSAEVVYRAAVAKVAIVIGVLGLAALTATGGPAALASFVEEWIDSFLPGADPAPVVELPEQGEVESDRGEGGQPSARPSQRPVGDGSPTASGNERARDRRASSPAGDTSVPGARTRETAPSGHGGAVPGQGAHPERTDSPTPAGVEDPAGGSAGPGQGSPPGRTGTPPGHAGPPGAGGASPGGTGEPPGHAGTSPAPRGGASGEGGVARGHGLSAPAQDGGSPGHSDGASGHQRGDAPAQNGPVAPSGVAARASGSPALVDVPTLGVVARTAVSVPVGG